MDNPRPEKVAVVTEVRERFERSSAAILTEYRGLSVKDLAALRRTLRDAGSEYKIYKNTLVRFAANDLGLGELDSLLTGPTAIAFVNGDASNVAKALRDYARTNPKLTVKGGVLGSKVMSSADATALADLPPREVVLARLAGALASPMQTFAGLLAAVPRNFAYGLKALLEKRGGVVGGPEPDATGTSASVDEETSTSADAPVALDDTSSAVPDAEAEPVAEVDSVPAGAPVAEGAAAPADVAAAPAGVTEEAGAVAEEIAAEIVEEAVVEEAIEELVEAAIVEEAVEEVLQEGPAEVAGQDAVDEAIAEELAEEAIEDAVVAEAEAIVEAEADAEAEEEAAIEVEPLAAHGIPAEVTPEILSVEPEPETEIAVESSLSEAPPDNETTPAGDTPAAD